MKLWDFISLIVLTILAGAAILAVPYVNVHALVQKVYLLNYQPPAEVAALADQAHMTQKAREYFYESRPQIDEDRTVFEQHCQAPLSSKLVELGCYTPDDRIYILRISDPKLQSEMTVVAAHEMLHAVYESLSEGDRSKIDEMVDAQYKSLNNPELNQEVKDYRLTEAGEKDNELHSLLGTEYYPLSGQMESYYAQFFSNRRDLIDQYQAFNQVFVSLQNRLDQLELQIKTDRAQMNSYLRNGNILSYNAMVPVINRLIDEYNQTADQYNQLSRSLAGTEQNVSSQ